jgi:hypothetical protein
MDLREAYCGVWPIKRRQGYKTNKSNCWFSEKLIFRCSRREEILCRYLFGDLARHLSTTECMTGEASQLHLDFLTRQKFKGGVILESLWRKAASNVYRAQHFVGFHKLVEFLIFEIMLFVASRGIVQVCMKDHNCVQY